MLKSPAILWSSASNDERADESIAMKVPDTNVMAKTTPITEENVLRRLLRKLVIEYLSRLSLVPLQRRSRVTDKSLSWYPPQQHRTVGVYIDRAVSLMKN